MTDQTWMDGLQRACPNRIGDSIFVPDWALWSAATGFLLFGSRRQLLIDVTPDGWVSVFEADREPYEAFAERSARSIETRDRVVGTDWLQRLRKRVALGATKCLAWAL